MKDLDQRVVALFSNIDWCICMDGNYTDDDVKRLEGIDEEINKLLKEELEMERDELPDYYLIAIGVKSYGDDVEYYCACCAKYDEYMRGDRKNEDLDEYFGNDNFNQGEE